MKKKLLIFGAAALMGIPFLSTSCGKKDDSLIINFWNTFQESTNNQVQEIANKFAAHVLETEGVKLKVVCEKQGTYSDISYKITSSFTNSAFPTITVAYPDHIANYLTMGKEKAGEYVVNLEPLINDPEIGLDKEPWYCDKGASDIVESFYDEGQHYIQEGIYSLPFMKSTELLTYNKSIVQDVLGELGITTYVDEYMKTITWEEMVEIAEYVDAHREQFGMDFEEGAKKKYPIFYDSDANLYITQSYQRDIPYIGMNEKRQGTIDIENDGAVDLLAELNDLHQRDLLVTRGIDGNYGSSAFVSQSCVFLIGSTAGASHSDPTAQDFEAGIVKMPSLSTVEEDRQKFVSQGVTLGLLSNPRDSKEKNDLKIKYGWKFMKYLTNTKNSIVLCTDSNGYIPARYSSYEDPEYKALINLPSHNSINCKTVIEQINGNYFNYPVFQGSDKAREYIGNTVTDALKLSKDKATPEKLKALLQTAANNTRKFM